jgi:hypothetical protein
MNIQAINMVRNQRSGRVKRIVYLLAGDPLLYVKYLKCTVFVIPMSTYREATDLTNLDSKEDRILRSTDLIFNKTRRG